MRGVFRFKGIGENLLCQCIALSRPQKLGRAVGEEDGLRPGVGLGVSHAQTTALFDVDRAAYFQSPGLAIEGLPFQAAKFSPPQAGGQLRIEEVVPERVLTDCRHQSVQLIVVENALWIARQFGRRHLVGGIDGQQALFHRGFQRVVEGRVDAADKATTSTPAPGAAATLQ